MSTPNDRLAHLVNDYITRYKPHADKETQYYQKFLTLEDCIHHAALARNSNGKRHPHQRRLSQNVLEQVSLTLLREVSEIAAVADFDGLIEIVSDSVVRGFGELAIYDTADRIGAWRGVRPKKVYLHEGTQVGARALGLQSKQRVLDRMAFPIALQALEASDIENFLCLYKHCFKDDQTSFTTGPCSGVKLPLRSTFC